MRRGKRTSVDPAQYGRYQRVAQSLLRSVIDINEIAETGGHYGNAIAIVAVHCCIAFSDALCVKFGGFKSSEGEHTRAADALREALGTRANEPMLKLQQRILGKKDHVSYQGSYFTVNDARQMVEDVVEFAASCEGLLR